MNRFIAIDDLANMFDGYFLTQLSERFDFIVEIAVLAKLADDKYLFVADMLGDDLQNVGFTAETP
jgi:hypothetical protein